MFIKPEEACFMPGDPETWKKKKKTSDDNLDNAVIFYLTILLNHCYH
jgi:hypothetical protein